ncbi:610_t:CDS:2 [Funneliformis mosseae]|uniref:610_t:CDS:1 n=1 Tax=Funneliformis mosseae TaxID=27381 RepID=A0A9N9BK57_FUNMO|nr:610_t:CDS:2 [Funneliformis mosseae]
MSHNLRKRTHSLIINSSPNTTDSTPHKKLKKSSNFNLRNKGNIGRPKQKDTFLDSSNVFVVIEHKNIDYLVKNISSKDDHLDEVNGDKDDKIEPLLLPTVVWVNDEERGWWPSEIISKDKSEIPLLVRLFGLNSPCNLELHTISKSTILPFHNKLYMQLRKTGENSNMKGLFTKALAEAIAKETEDNDGLPSEDWAIQMVVENSSPNKKKRIGKSLSNEQLAKEINNSSIFGKESPSWEKSISSDFEIGKDGNLQIPGEYVLAKYQKKFYPATIIGFDKPDKYKVRFFDNVSHNLKRKEFFTKYEDGFKTCELGCFEMDYEDPTYEEPELVKTIQSLEPILSQILRGKENSSWRFQHFYMGGKKRNLLASKVSPGPFTLSQFGLIAKVLRGMFIPEIAESIDKKSKILSPKKLTNKRVVNDETITIQHEESLFNSELSNDMKLRFVNDVLLPETIIRLIMIDEKIGYKEADCKMLDGYNELRWVENLIAERTSFQVGRESLREKA